MKEQSPAGDDVLEDADDLLKEMLGGINFDGEWAEDDTEDISQRLLPGKVSELQTKRAQPSTTTRRIVQVKDCTPVTDVSSNIFSYSYRCSGYCSVDGRIEHPPLDVVDLGPNRGYGLILTSPIDRGSVIYTERAATATQVPPATIQACQYCFRSLECISKLSDDLPHGDLWPVPKLQFDDLLNDTKETTNNLQVDVFGRVRCTSCKSLFCTKHHFEMFCREYGNCCPLADILKAVETATQETEEQATTVQAAVALTARLFAHCIQYFRINEQRMEGHFLEGFCGQENDLDALELGIKDSTGHYSLERLYMRIETILDLTTDEKKTFSLTYLHNVAAKAGRNGFGLLTQSPFKSYYAGLLRKSTSRDSEEHQANMRKVAQALVGSDTLQRGMDRDIEAKVAPEICAVFPLTARCNHSCEPNAQVRSQEFVDSHIDVVALRDLAAGEELLISYIPVGAGVGKRSTVQRRRDLQAKYLFHCECSLCNL